jgi:hypothetical protein
VYLAVHHAAKEAAETAAASFALCGRGHAPPFLEGFINEENQMFFDCGAVCMRLVCVVFL